MLTNKREEDPVQWECVCEDLFISKKEGGGILRLATR